MVTALTVSRVLFVRRLKSLLCLSDPSTIMIHASEGGVAYTARCNLTKAQISSLSSVDAMDQDDGSGAVVDSGATDYFSPHRSDF